MGSKAGPRTTRIKFGSPEWKSLIGVASEAINTDRDIYITIHPTGITGNHGIATISVDPPR